MGNVKNLTRGALFIALGLIIPFAFHSIGGPAMGRIFLPMHIPVLLSGFFCGPIVGLFVGIITPLLSSVFIGMPPLVPTAQMMALELATFGFLSGLLYHHIRWGVYPSLLLAMIGGRLVYGTTGYLILPLFGLEQVPILYPLSYGLITGLPGIVIQLILIPLIVYLLSKHVLLRAGSINS